MRIARSSGRALLAIGLLALVTGCVVLSPECDCPTPPTDANYPPDVQGPFLATIESCAAADWLRRSPIVWRGDHYASDSIWSSCQAAFEDCQLRGQRCCDARVERCTEWGEPIE